MWLGGVRFNFNQARGHARGKARLRGKAMAEKPGVEQVRSRASQEQVPDAGANFREKRTVKGRAAEAARSQFLFSDQLIK
jgi:hypothetical protein